MKLKIFLAAFISLSALFFNNTSFAYDYYEVGKQFYEESMYDQAEAAFIQAVNNNPYNLNYKYYLALTYINRHKLKEAEAEYEKIISISPNSETAKLSVIGLSKIKQYEINAKNAKYSLSHMQEGNKAVINKYKYGDNYIDNAINTYGNIVRWSSGNMPVTYYIEQSDSLGSTNSKYTNLIIRAFNSWAGISDNKLSFKQIDDVKSANIKITYSNLLDNKSLNSGFTSGLTRPFYSKNILQCMSIMLLPKTKDGKFFSDSKFYNTILHEIGHSLGILGHSAQKGDVMYPVAKSDGNENNYMKLSSRDKSTIKLLYDIDPDISNFTKEELAALNSKEKVSLFDSKDDRLATKLREAQEYVKKVPDSPRGWIHIAAIYKAKKDYRSALYNYKKALSLDANNKGALVGMIEIYDYLNDEINTITHYKKLISVDQSDISSQISFAKYYIKKDKSNEAGSVISNLIRVNPSAKNDKSVIELMQKLNVQ